MSCKYPGCPLPVFAGSSFCSISHRDAASGTQPSPSQPRPPGFQVPSRSQISFYERGQPYYEFTNFSDHPIRYDGKDYPTAEHLFQSLKFEDNTLIELIRTQLTPRAAFETAQKYNTMIRPGWYDKQLNIKMMEKTVLLKFTQHQDLKKLLIGTGDAVLKENSPIDRFWGIGSDGRGENHLGLVLMRIRALLKNT
ncbi:hypothetical protein Clacol_004467 [Clathrus columnatus]|uniref:NADAR domain-containing protein n=1 Tax=Clathrus columnatus TaxID=1419009 RepID=A0AAV5AB39_9AGAM|nr:hypothetical protein Clacol_004467 [Clathrus columnatus]